MNFGIIGTGYVAEFYANALRCMPDSKLFACTDLIFSRAELFARKYECIHCLTFEEMLGADELDAVIILTEPQSHKDLARRSLLGGKHVYCEKPLTLDISSAVMLFRLAEENNLVLSAGPCNVLNPVTDKASKLIENGAIGRPLLAYAAVDDGAVHKMAFKSWKRDYGATWPAEHEFEMGCVLEHASYAVGVLLRLLGKATKVISTSMTLIPEKIPGMHSTGHDFAMAGIYFLSGAFARLTCGIVAPRDRSVKIIGEEGVLLIDDIWDDRSKLWLGKAKPTTAEMPHDYLSTFTEITVSGAEQSSAFYDSSHYMDFTLGLKDLADAVSNGTSSRLSGEFALQALEIVLAVESSSTIVLGEHY